MPEYLEFTNPAEICRDLQNLGSEPTRVNRLWAHTWKQLPNGLRCFLKTVLLWFHWMCFYVDVIAFSVTLLNLKGIFSCLNMSMKKKIKLVSFMVNISWSSRCFKIQRSPSPTEMLPGGVLDRRQKNEPTGRRQWPLTQHSSNTPKQISWSSREGHKAPHRKKLFPVTHLFPKQTL